jgi:transcription elongation factor
VAKIKLSVKKGTEIVHVPDGKKLVQKSYIVTHFNLPPYHEKQILRGVR